MDIEKKSLLDSDNDPNSPLKKIIIGQMNYRSINFANDDTIIDINRTDSDNLVGKKRRRKKIGSFKEHNKEHYNDNGGNDGDDNNDDDNNDNYDSVNNDDDNNDNCDGGDNDDNDNNNNDNNNNDINNNNNDNKNNDRKNKKYVYDDLSTPWNFRVMTQLKKIGEKSIGYKWMHEQK